MKPLENSPKTTTSQEPLKPSPSPKAEPSSGSRRLTPSERESLKKTVRSLREQTAKEFPNIKFVE